MTSLRPWHAALAASLALAVAGLLALAAGGGPWRGDAASHVAEIDWAAGELASGRLPLWFGDANLGYAPLFSYPPAPLLASAALTALAGGALAPETVVGLLAAVLWALLPLAWYRGGREVGLGPGPAVAAALVAIAATDIDGFGFGLRSWLVSGLYSQVWAAPLVPLALGASCRHGRGELGARAPALLLAALILCHPIHGLWTLLAAATFAAAGGRRQSLRFLLPAGVAIAATAWWWLPFVLTGDAQGGLPWQRPIAGGHGPLTVASALVRGELLDHGRLPWLTVLAGAGLVIAAACHRREPLGRALLAFTVLAFALVAGIHRPFPVVGDIEAIRFLPALQACAFLAAGIALAAAVSWLRGHAEARPAWQGRGLTIAVGALIAAHLVTRAIIAYHLARPARPPAAETARLAAALAGTRGRVMTHPDLGTRSVHYANRIPHLAGRPTLLSNGRGFHDTRSTRYLLDFEPSADGLRLYGVGAVLARRLPAELPPHVRIAWSDGVHHILVPTGEVPAVHVVRAPFAVRGDREQVAEALVDVVPRLFARGVLPPVCDADCPRGTIIDVGELGPRRAADQALALAAAAAAPSSRVLAASQPRGRSLAVEVDIAAEGDLVAVPVSHHPYWRATIDGARAPVIRLAPNFVGVAAPPGRHRLALCFAPPAWIGWLAAVTALALLVWIAAPIPARWRSRRRDPSGPDHHLSP